MDATVIEQRRDVRVIGLIGFGHCFSHFYQLALPPLFPLMHEQLGYSYTQLGLLVSLFYLASALAQPPAGFLVDRFGARAVLFLGFGLEAGATALIGLYPEYWAICVFAIFAGIGNAAFHPADFSILNATVAERRMARAYSAHNFGGFIGYAAGPAIMVAAAVAFGWRGALIVTGVGGLIVLAVIAMLSGEFRDSTDERRAAPEAAAPAPSNYALLFRTPVVLCLVFFIFISGAQIGVQTFSTAALMSANQMPFALANAALTVFLAAAPIGIIVGGILVDRSLRLEPIAIVGYGLAAALILAVGLTGPGSVVLFILYAIAGFSFGVAFPARDMLVRSVTPKGASGKVFGFVYSGLDIGSAVTPVLFGWLVDHDRAHIVFILIAVLTMLAIGSVLISRRSAAGPAAVATK